MTTLLDDRPIELTYLPCDLHGLADCATCFHLLGECDYGACSEPAELWVLCHGEMRAMCITDAVRSARHLGGLICEWYRPLVGFRLPAFAEHNGEHLRIVCPPEWRARVEALGAFTVYGPHYRMLVTEHLETMSRDCRSGFSVSGYSWLLRAERAAGITSDSGEE